MKRILHAALFILMFCYTFKGISQTYKTDTKDIFTWNTAADDWELELHEVYTYENGGDKETKITGYAMPGMILTHQNIKMYNGNNDIISDERQAWNSVTSQWINSTLVEYTYDASGNLTGETHKTFNFIQNDYINSFREVYSDYSGSDFGKQTSQNWDTNTNPNQWVNDEELVIMYMSPGNPESAIFYEWDNGAWSAYERVEATYSMGMISETLSEEYNGSTWEESERTFFTYENGLEKELLTQIKSGMDWINEDRDTSGYDANGNRIVFTLESWDVPSDDWEPYYKEEKSFSMAGPLSTDLFEDENFKVYPNPAKTIINISSKIAIDKVELYNVLGYKVLETYNAKQLNIENLSGGIYLLKAYGNKATTTKRIVVE
ncbi:T9SS type A sorting domain-containing protein [Hyunsoonleella flava]|uniref:T9SS type A sorting domain-containing protein n=1 Tax=Hyunsoonleella flava TaxID=2527939 RepID=A0A4Q9FHF0_9FLAO|nr:T9SS type A sorting domain-containing protein [Hyunsoonleella flava]TBN04303.1 T9SS type A sorting domain-containing protein [Hyunsoonleella flava]